MADVCILCTRSLRQRRRHILSEHFAQTRQEFVVHIVHAIQPPQEVRFKLILFKQFFFFHTGVINGSA